jgi:hypothetical protein
MKRTAGRRVGNRSKEGKTTTPVRGALLPTSTLLPQVRDGLGAVNQADHGCIDVALQTEFADSLDLDAALESAHPQEPRWDYLLGHRPSALVIALEPHSARRGEVSTVIAKRKAAREQLRPHLKPSARIAGWFWVASGRLHFADTETVRRRLDQNGITFVGRRLMTKHIPEQAEA